MAGISKEDAEKVLKKYGYKVQEHLGEGAGSHVFKCMHPKDKDRLIAVKVCQPVDNAWASLKDEIEAADELERMERDIEKRINSEKNPELKKAMRKNFSGFFKYSNKPKRVKIPGQVGEFAIFEAEIADSDVLEAFCETYAEKRKDQKEMNPDFSNADEVAESAKPTTDYKELRRVAKDTLKGLKNMHDEGKVHGDIRVTNILKRFDANKGKNIYSLTDFGTMKSFHVKGKIGALIKLFGETDSSAKEKNRALYEKFCKGVANDIWKLGESLMILWYRSFGWGEGSFGCIVDDLQSGWFDNEVALKIYRGFCINYTTTKEDRVFLNFCKKLTKKNWKERPSASIALEDPFIKNK